MTALRSSALVLAALLATATTQAAEPQVLAAVLKNTTNIVIHYQYKVNNEAWYKATLNPGSQHIFSVPYPSAAPTVQIRWDNRTGDKKATYTNTTLAMHVTSAPKYGWLQVFHMGGDGKDICFHR